MSKKGFNKAVRTVEKECGRIEKSHFVIADWIVKCDRHVFNIKQGKKKNNNNRRKGALNSIYVTKNKAVNQLIRANMVDIKISKPKLCKFYWLYVLEFERKGLRMEIVIPYLAFRNKIEKDISELEETITTKDSIFLNGENITRKIRTSDFKLSFILENLEKSRLKLVEKMEEANGTNSN